MYMHVFINHSMSYASLYRCVCIYIYINMQLVIFAPFKANLYPLAPKPNTSSSGCETTTNMFILIFQRLNNYLSFHQLHPQDIILDYILILL